MEKTPETAPEYTPRGREAFREYSFASQLLQRAIEQGLLSGRRKQALLREHLSSPEEAIVTLWNTCLSADSLICESFALLESLSSPHDGILRHQHLSWAHGRLSQSFAMTHQLPPHQRHEALLRTLESAELLLESLLFSIERAESDRRARERASLVRAVRKDFGVTPPASTSGSFPLAA